MQPNRREVIVSASTLALLAGVARAETRRPSVASGGRERLDDNWRFAFGHLEDIDRDFGFGLFLRTFAKQGPDNQNPAQPSDGVAVSLGNYDDSQWRRLNLPHDWAVELPFIDRTPHTRKSTSKFNVWDDAAGHGFKPIGRDFPETSVGWYRREIRLSPDDRTKRIRIDFDGVFQSAFVMFNGYIVKEHRGGYVPFSVDVTDFVNTDDQPNILTLRVDASLGEGWYYEGAGIYRHVWLTKHETLHIVKDGLCVRANGDGSLAAAVTIRNDGNETQMVFTRIDVFGNDGKPVAAWKAEAPTELSPSSETDIPLTLVVPSARQWSLEDPYCYHLTAAISIDQLADLDTASIAFGFRDIRFDADEGFYLNGKNVKIKGTCNHQDHAGVGVAVPDALWAYRLQCLKDMGCNAIRTAHNPPAPELLDACDRMGMLVLDETRMMSSADYSLDQLRTMIVRDRNHPSIFLWSIGNEEPKQGTQRGVAIARSMKRLVRQLDPTRSVTAAMDHRHGEGITSVLDVMGFNYNDGKIDKFHEAFPTMPIIGSETASALSTRGEYIYDPVRRVVPAYDVDAASGDHIAETWWTHFNAKSFISGGFLWTGFDYRGEPTPWQELPSVSSHFGVMDTCGFPKDTYYYYRAWWRSEPLLHLFPHWNWEDGKDVSVWVFSNCDAVELFVNGKSAGRKVMKKDSHLEWIVPFAPGKIEAYGYTGDKVILKAARETVGEPKTIVLTADRTDLTADGRDCAVLRAEVVDAKGRTVPTANNLLQFSVSAGGTIIGVGNGDPNCHEPDKGDKRSAYNGLASVIVQAGKAAGRGFVTATAPGLISGKVALKFT